MSELVAFLLLAGALVSGPLVWRAAERRALVARWQMFALTFPRELDAERVRAALVALSGESVRPLVLEVVASRSGIEHRLRVAREQAGWVVRQLRATLPGLRVVPLESPEPLAVDYACELAVSSPQAELRTDNPEGVAAALLASVQPLGKAERLVVQWVLYPIPPLRVREPITVPVVVAHELRVRRDTQAEQARRQKAAWPLFRASVRLAAAAGDGQRARRLALRPWAVLSSLRTPLARVRRLPWPSWLVCRRVAEALPSLGHPPSVVSAAELVAALGWPVGSPQVAGLRLGTARLLAPAPGVPERGRVLGTALATDVPRRVAVSAADALRHSYVVGPTGAGKSTLLTNLIVSDLRAGHGVVVLDPKGDLISDVLDRVPRERVADVILLDPTDAARPVGLNVLAGAERDPELVVDQVVGIFARLYAASWGPRTEDVLRAGLLTLARVPGLTLCELPRLLLDEGFRRRLVGGLDDPLGLEPFWAWYAALRDAERAQIVAPVMNKLRAVLLRSSIRSIIGQAESSFDLAGLLAERRVLLVNLPKGRLGEDTAKLLGSLVVARLWQAVQGRAGLPPARRRAVFAYLDEFQDFLSLPSSLTDVLAQARGLGFGLTLAHQHTWQLPPEVREAVLANAATKVVFQTGATDAARLSREFAPHVTAEDLQHLGAHEVYIAPCVAGQTQPPLSAVTLPAPPVEGYGEAVRQRSRQQFGRERSVVERELRERHGGRIEAGPVGRRRR